MKHGQEIRRYTKTTYGPEQTLVDATTGETVYCGPMSSQSETITVHHCDNCGEVELGFLQSIICDRACPSCGKEWRV